MSDMGFIVIDRKITEWKWWGNVYAMSIWLYILMSANWKDGYWAVTGEAVNRGSFITSLSRMAKELSLDRRTIKHWLDVFKSDGQIDFACTRQCTRITVIKYGFYQDHDSDHVQPDVQPNVQPDVQPDVHNRTKKQSNKETIVIKENNKEKILPGSQADTDDTSLSTKTATVGREEKADVKTATVMRATEEAMEVIDYLNSQTGSHYRHTKGNIRHVTARLNEGYTVQDCKTVIDKKCAEWLMDDRMQQYLRPETLFGSKFESYLNQRVVKYSPDRSGQGRKEISLPDYMNRPQPGPEEDPDLLAELLEWQRKNGGQT